jgi:hypothetical protein
LALGKAFFAERPKKNARQSLRRSAKKWIPVVSVVNNVYYNFIGWRNDQTKVVDLDEFYIFVVDKFFI